MDSWLPFRSELRYNGSEHSRTLGFSNVEPSSSGMECILSLFGIAMGRWAEEVQSALQADSSKNNVSYLSGFRFDLSVQWFEHTFLVIMLPGFLTPVK